MIRLPSYLQQSAHGVYYFRAAVPVALRSRLGRREIKCSLATRSRAEAIDRARSISLSIRHLYGYLSQSESMNYREFRALLQRDLDELMERMDRYLERNGPLPFEERFGLEQSLREKRGLAALDAPIKAGEAAAKRILEQHGIELDPLSKEFRKFTIWATKMVVAQIEGILAKNAALEDFGQGRTQTGSGVTAETAQAGLAGQEIDKRDTGTLKANDTPQYGPYTGITRSAHGPQMVRTRRPRR